MDTSEIVDTLCDIDQGGVESVAHSVATAIIDGLKTVGFVVVPQESGVLFREVESLDLPAPRLQLRWLGDDEDYSRNCVYELVLPLREHDIRRDAAPSGFLAIPMGNTKVSGGSRPRIGPDGKIDIPFRDGSHIKWDMAVLTLPAFAVLPDGRSMEIKAAP